MSGCKQAQIVVIIFNSLKQFIKFRVKSDKLSTNKQGFKT